MPHSVRAIVTSADRRSSPTSSASPATLSVGFFLDRASLFALAIRPGDETDSTYDRRAARPAPHGTRRSWSTSQPGQRVQEKLEGRTTTMTSLRAVRAGFATLHM